MSKKSTSTTLRLYRALVEAAERFAKKYEGHDRHWALVHWCRIGAIKDGVPLEPSDAHAESLAACPPLGKSPKLRLTIRIDSDVVMAACEAEASARRSDHTRAWWLVHWMEVGAIAEGAQMFDLDGRSSRGWGHGFEFGDRVEHNEFGPGALIAVGPDSLTAALDRGGVVNGQVESFVRVAE